MSKPTIVNYDLATGENTKREMTDTEYANYQAQCNKINETKAEVEAKVIAKAALLAQLGITEEQAKLLLS